MPRLARSLFQEKKLFHIMVQGINKEKIFKNSNEKLEYISLIKKYKNDYNLFVISYCLMDNHSHLLVYSEETKNLTDFMHSLNTSYAIFYNKKYNRVGYVYRDRFKVQIISDREHLYNCILYIHNNPVKAKLCDSAKEYKYSSYNEFMKLKEPECINGLFINEKEYEKAHDIRYMTNMDYIEEPESVDFNINNEINDFLIINKITFNDIKNNEIFLKVLVNDLRKKYNLSNRKIASYLNISKEKVKKYYDKN